MTTAEKPNRVQRTCLGQASNKLSVLCMCSCWVLKVPNSMPMVHVCSCAIARDWHAKGIHDAEQ